MHLLARREVLRRSRRGLLLARRVLRGAARRGRALARGELGLARLVRQRIALLRHRGRGNRKQRGKPDPGGFDSARLLPLTYAMAMVILLVSVILIFADIVAPVSLS